MAKKKRHTHLLEKMQKSKALTQAELKELAKFEGGQISPGIVENLSQVAKVFKVTYRTVQRWAVDGMPATSDGKYDLTEIQAWKLARADKTGSKKNIDKEKYEANFRKYKALLAEIDYRTRLGELIPRDEVESGRVQRILAVKTAFLSLPQTLAPQLVGLDARQIMAIMDKRIIEIIEKFSNKHGKVGEKIVKHLPDMGERRI